MKRVWAKRGRREKIIYLSMFTLHNVKVEPFETYLTNKTCVMLRPHKTLVLILSNEVTKGTTPFTPDSDNGQGTQGRTKLLYLELRVEDW